MNHMAAVLEDAALLAMLLQQMLQFRLLPTLGSVACASRRLRSVAEVAARSAVLQVCPQAFLIATEIWAAHWTLLAATGRNGRGRAALIRALYRRADAESSLGGTRLPALPAATLEQLTGAERALAALVGWGGRGAAAQGRGAGRGRRGDVERLLSVPGELTLLPLQRSLLRRLCFEAGALRQAPVLARLTVRKTAGTGMEAEALLDLAEVLNLRAYMRTYVSREPEATAELEEALLAAKRAKGLAPSPRASRLLGRTLASAAHAMMLQALDPPITARLMQEWGGGFEMFQAATQELQDSMKALRVAADSPGASLELATTTASLGECWFCIAAAAEHNREKMLGFSWRGAANCSRVTLTESIELFVGADLTHTVEHADALKDLGKLLNSFDLDVPYAHELLTASLDLHRGLLGACHPRTRNVMRLLDD